MDLHMFLQLIAAVEVLSTLREVTNVLALLAMYSAVLCEVGRLGEFLSADITH
jgi:hypothetical protein